MKKNITFFVLLMLSGTFFVANEQKVQGVDGRVLLISAMKSCSQTSELKEELRYVSGMYLEHRKLGFTATNIAFIRYMAEIIESPALPALNNLMQRLDSISDTNIAWKPYLTGTFVDKNNNTLLHKLVELCDQQDNTKELTSLVKEIDSMVGPYGVIPMNLNNIHGSATDEQSAFMPLAEPYRKGISPSFKNNNGQTAMSVLDEKLKHNAEQGVSCASCEGLSEWLQILSKKEQERT